MHSILRKFVKTITILNCLLQIANTSSRIDALVDTKLGLIRGLQAPDGDYAMFLGIPYAKVEEDNPFGPSTPFPKFDEVFEAYDDSTFCPQMNHDRTSAIGSIDCLHLNVYVPNKADSKFRLPVLVWIYGGAFSMGYYGRNWYGPRNLVRHDVILVTLNYRLGPYGFMCLDTPKVPGNQGLKDQQLALKWVKDNIDAFGGDANDITLFGQSAGGVSVDLHLYYTENRLFNKAILQSGSALCPWAVEESDQSIPIKIAQHLGFQSNNIEEIVSYLATISPELVIAASTELNLKYSPCVEKEFKSVERFIGNSPINTNLGNLKDLPILIGHNDEESLGMVQGILSLQEQVFQQNLKTYFNFESDELNEMENIIKNFYIGEEPSNKSNIMSILDFSSDFTNNYPTVRSVNRYLENGATSLFFYVFSYNGGQNFELHIEPNVFNISRTGASHGDELGYLFTQPSSNIDVSKKDQLIIDQITTLWTNFAKSGNPTPEKSDLLPVTWAAVSQDTMTYLNLGSEISVGRRVFHDRMAFWDLFYKLNKKSQKGYQPIN